MGEELKALGATIEFVDIGNQTLPDGKVLSVPDALSIITRLRLRNTYVSNLTNLNLMNHEKILFYMTRINF